MFTWITDIAEIILGCCETGFLLQFVQHDILLGGTLIINVHVNISENEFPSIVKLINALRCTQCCQREVRKRGDPPNIPPNARLTNCLPAHITRGDICECKYDMCVPVCVNMTCVYLCV